MRLAATFGTAWLVSTTLLASSGLRAQDLRPPPPLPTVPAVPLSPAEQRPLPINLPTALQLANAQALDVATAAVRIQVAAAALEQAQVLWLPTITIGGDYNRHDGRNQDSQGNVFDNSRSGMMLGLGTGIGPAAILNVNDAIFAPLVARQQMHARQADLQAASNDTLVNVTDAYFNVQQARGELVGAVAATHRTEELVRRTKELASGLVPELEVVRAEAELSRREQAEQVARERWQVAGAELVRLLRLDAGARVEPAEPPQLRIELVDLHQSVDDLIGLALTSRPELASQQAQVQATLAMLKQERLRPLIPSILLRGSSTPVTGTLAAGYYGGGANSSISNGALRSDLDLQVLWQFDNLGFGNRARVHQREAENRVAVLNLFRVQDRIAAEVVQAYAEADSAAHRITLAEKEARLALDSADKNLAALSQTKRVGNLVQTIVRPQEAIAAVQALAQATNDYYGAVADSNRAQFRLYRALGKPAQCVLHDQTVPTSAAPPIIRTSAEGPALGSPEGPSLFP